MSGVPFVLIRPNAFMETCIGMLTDGIRKDGTAMIFGDGRTVVNYIALEDVAEFSLRIFMRSDVVSELIEIGGPSHLSGEQLDALMEAHLGMSVKRRRVPKAVLWAGGSLLRPFTPGVLHRDARCPLRRLGGCQRSFWRCAADHRVVRGAPAAVRARRPTVRTLFPWPRRRSRFSRCLSTRVRRAVLHRSDRPARGREALRNRTAATHLRPRDPRPPAHRRRHRSPSPDPDRRRTTRA